MHLTRKLITGMYWSMFLESKKPRTEGCVCQGLPMHQHETGEPREGKGDSKGCVYEGGSKEEAFNKCYFVLSIIHSRGQNPQDLTTFHSGSTSQRCCPRDQTEGSIPITAQEGVREMRGREGCA